MKKPEVTRNWRLMAPIVVAVICVTAMAVSMCDKGEAEEGMPAGTALNTPSLQPDPPPLVIEWKGNAGFEALIAQKAAVETDLLRGKLSELAAMEKPPSGPDLKNWIEAFRNTFFEDPTFSKDGSTDKNQGWPQIIEDVWASVHGATISFLTLRAEITYKQHPGASNPHFPDIPAREDHEHDVTLILTYSTSNGDPEIGGTDKHSRVCTWI